MIPVTVESLSELFSGDNMIAFILLAIFNTAILYSVSVKYLQCLQQSSYVGESYLRWLFERDNAYKIRLGNLAILSTLSYLVFSIAFSYLNSEIVSYLGFGFYLVFTIVYLKKERSKRQRQPLCMTHRMERNCGTLIFLYFVINMVAILGLNAAAFAFKNNLLSIFRYSFLCLTPSLTPYVTLLSFYVNMPFEKWNNGRYIRRTTKILEERSDLIKIGITGSYGKTSVKLMLKTILKEKYDVLATPESFNTPLGISRTVLERMEPSTEVFIAEMGARRVGDIDELCDEVKPDYGIITGITCQHLETFKTMDNIIETKSALYRRAKKAVVFSFDNDVSKKMYEFCTVKKLGAGIDGTDVFAKDIQSFSGGSRFTLSVRGEEIEVTTKLLGRHNVSNICLAAAMSAELGLTIEEIALGISKIEQIPHRLQLINNNRLTVIDDSYNSNPDGVKAALEVLRSFEGRRIVVTPGMVELGERMKEENERFGHMLAEFDEVLLVGKRTEAIEDGLKAEGKTYQKFDDLQGAKEYLLLHARAGDVVLFENDLPDKYN